MIIYEALKKDHEKVRGLLKQLIATEKSNTKAAKALVKEIRDELVPHSRAEEAVLYNSIRDTGLGKEVVAHSYGEHMKAETLLRSLQAMEAFDVNSVNTAKKLLQDLEHHIAEEEGRIFDAARQLFTAEEAEAMGEVFEKMKPEIKGESFLKTTFDMMVNMMPARLRASFAKFVPQAEGAEHRKAS